MFDQNDQSQQTQNSAVMPEPVADSSTPALTTPQVTTPDPLASSAPLTTTPDPLQSDTESSFNTTTLETPETTTDSISSTSDTVTPEPFTTTPSDETGTAPVSESDDLLSIKQEALQNLSPLLSQLEQSPEEKFRTTMMLIQASDNQSLIQSAYTAAKEIEDEKVRAQALLDIVNEINYFTQHKAEKA
ncbi:MAG: hypothetical protein QG628_290 [Patescibacteria group bacterium]|jgi:hypothetical protein|nr:hypothetical protein [Patescibacteria group bacterium]